MAKQKLTALRTFEGNEGLIRRGDVFEVTRNDRADQLKKLQLAEAAPDDAKVTNLGQLNSTLSDTSRTDLEKQAKALDVRFTDDTTDDALRAAIIKAQDLKYIQNQTAQTEGTNHPAPAESK